MFQRRSKRKTSEVSIRSVLGGCTECSSNSSSNYTGTPYVRPTTAYKNTPYHVKNTYNGRTPTGGAYTGTPCDMKNTCLTCSRCTLDSGYRPEGLFVTSASCRMTSPCRTYKCVTHQNWTNKFMYKNQGFDGFVK